MYTPVIFGQAFLKAYRIHSPRLIRFFLMIGSYPMDL